MIRFTSVPGAVLRRLDAQLWLDLHPCWLAAGDAAAFAITEGGDDRPVGSIRGARCHLPRARPRPATTSSPTLAGAASRLLRSDSPRAGRFAELEARAAPAHDPSRQPSLARGRREGRVHPRRRAAGRADQRGERVDPSLMRRPAGRSETPVRRGWMPVVESHAAVAARPADVFAFLHDPAQRPVWDVAEPRPTWRAESAAAGSRLPPRGRRKAPSWWRRVRDDARAAAVGAAPRGRRRHAVLGWGR